MLAYLKVWRQAIGAASAGNVPSAPHTETAPSPPGGAARHFIRLGEDILPIDLDRIICITGAGDYAEVTTLDKTHLVKMTLVEFSRTLDPAKFLRAHRSAIVNMHRIARAESAGGGWMHGAHDHRSDHHRQPCGLEADSHPDPLTPQS